MMPCAHSSRGIWTIWRLARSWPRIHLHGDDDARRVGHGPQTMITLGVYADDRECAVAAAASGRLVSAAQIARPGDLDLPGMVRLAVAEALELAAPGPLT